MTLVWLPSFEPLLGDREEREEMMLVWLSCNGPPALDLQPSPTAQARPHASVPVCVHACLRACVCLCVRSAVFVLHKHFTSLFDWQGRQQDGRAEISFECHAAHIWVRLGTGWCRGDA